MANTEADSPSMFAGLDSFDLGEGTLDDRSLAADIGDDPTTTTTAAAASSADETTAAVAGGTPPAVSNISSVSPSAVSSGPPPSFFAQDPSNWSFQDTTPPYDSTGGESPFGPVSQHSWDLPVHLGLNQPYLQQQQQQKQQQQPLYFQSPTPSGPNPDLDVAAAFSGSFAFNPNDNQGRPNYPRDIRNTLTPAQQERLRTIAMPPHLQYHSPKSTCSPDSGGSGHDKGAGSSPDAAEPPKSGSRKRKSSAEVDDDDDDDDDLDGHQPVKKTAHNMIEKRYRTNLNDKIAALRDSVPALRIMSKSARGEDTTEDREELHGLTPAHKLNKATVLSKATEYIRHLEKRNNRLLEENSSMQARISAFEKLFMAGAISGQLPNPLQQPPTPIQYPHDAIFMNTPMATPRGEPQGLIPVPDDMKRIHASQQMNAGRPYPVPAQFGQNPTVLRQQQIQQQQQQGQGGNWSPYFNRMMLGSLAGMMIVEALVEKEQSSETPEGRGLFAFPVQLLSSFVHSTHFSIGGYYLSGIDALAKLRLFALVGMFFWAACSSFVDLSIFREPEKPKHSSPVQAVPSLASSMQTKRTAWLTAIQTVWVPRHNFWLEAAALSFKVLKCAAKNVFGHRGFLMLAGLDEEQESARIKAWIIALDAQLSGGDVEINKSRLTLTLLASCTLPETPLRLMIKALHIRVLLWRINGASWMTNVVAAKIARSWWNSARQLNLILSSLHEGNETLDEILPEHLALLLEQDCDEVLNDEIVQRAHSLAWNNTGRDSSPAERIDGMDTVVYDPAVISPMDAVAAWCSTIIVHRALVSSLSKNDGGITEHSRSVSDDIALAIKIAPTDSNAHVRALVACAVLVKEKRGAHILTAKQALDTSRNPNKHLHYSMELPPLIDDPDARLALEFSKATALLQRPIDPPEDACVFINSILPKSTVDMTFLAYTAAFHLMESLHRHAICRETCSRTLERLAGTLRIWIGSSAGAKAGVDGAMRQKMINRCLTITKSVVGMEADPGYASMDDCDEDGDGC
ncbi:hypothetical protein B0H63DRAFT_204959 [Podospora didyma]|uniref:BHLH domain-containing protein n=1 Tax=Podospora didyma TaxID=330526 RepID=A0AAE0NH51_9PEZI|nr:hypothetical protein B0H63DRAFT_204959 [Podospora didyma]